MLTDKPLSALFTIPTKGKTPALRIGFDMTPLRRKRLLLLATMGGDHKRWYIQYCQLAAEGLTSWAMGTAFLTDKGREELDKLK
jgi:hypothetical protein